ncbi:transcription factor MYB12-like protein [Corchorus olitorius]|uniref:Transcription factor MYB12-like protein n=1 Tax=Corchorus olitorius TaxID=93759 RepID=A0A1R3ISY8_9ROSI|nr:transcription factor MYB12-like protein [Corchorus olitorius]
MIIKGAWTAQEDRILKEQIRVHGEFIKNYWKTQPMKMKPGNSDESKTEAGQRDSDKFFMSNIANDVVPQTFATQDK